MYYINLDGAKRRHNDFLESFGCIPENRLHRISGVNGSDTDDVGHHIVNDMKTIAGVIEDLPGRVWEKGSYIQQMKTPQLHWHGALGTTISHLKAALQMYNDGHDYALILEDDVSPELVPLWHGTIEG